MCISSRSPRVELSHEQFVPKCQSKVMSIPENTNNLWEWTHVSMVTALLGTVRRRLIDNPLYSPVQPSLRMSLVVVYMIPPRTCRLIMPSEDISSARGRRWV
jgi:hypothetical protein